MKIRIKVEKNEDKNLNSENIVFILIYEIFPKR